MKNRFLFLVLTTTILISACSSDDNDASSGIEITEANLLGKWKLTSTTENGNSLNLDKCELLYTIILSKNDQGENRASYIEAIQQGDSCEESTSVDYIWLITSGNILNTQTLVEGSDQGTEKIVELTANTLVLESLETEGSEEFIYVDSYTKQ